jgi:hypothetical protein
MSWELKVNNVGGMMQIRNIFYPSVELNQWPIPPTHINKKYHNHYTSDIYNYYSLSSYITSTSSRLQQWLLCIVIVPMLSYLRPVKRVTWINEPIYDVSRLCDLPPTASYIWWKRIVIVNVAGVVVVIFFTDMSGRDGSLVQFHRRVKYISDLHHPTNIVYF